VPTGTQFQTESALSKTDIEIATNLISVPSRAGQMSAVSMRESFPRKALMIPARAQGPLQSAGSHTARCHPRRLQDNGSHPAVRSQSEGDPREGVTCLLQRFPARADDADSR
jgi:hypothetical protein